MLISDTLVAMAIAPSQVGLRLRRQFKAMLADQLIHRRRGQGGPAFARSPPACRPLTRVGRPTRPASGVPATTHDCYEIRHRCCCLATKNGLPEGGRPSVLKFIGEVERGSRVPPCDLIWSTHQLDSEVTLEHSLRIRLASGYA